MAYFYQEQFVEQQQAILSVSCPFYPQPIEDIRKKRKWQDDSKASMLCIVCNTIVRSAHQDHCSYKNSKDLNPKNCVCNIRAKSHDIFPICKSCHVHLKELINLLFGFEYGKKQTGYLYTTKFKSSMNSANYVCIMYGVAKNISSPTNTPNSSSDSLVDFITKESNEHVYGHDVRKKHYFHCHNCSFQASMICIESSNKNSNIHGMSHDEKTNIMCSNCCNNTFNRVCFWETCVNENLDENYFTINQILEQKDSLAFPDQYQRQCNDYFISGPDRYDPKLDFQHKVTNTDKNALEMSFVNVLRLLMSGKNLKINSTQELTFNSYDFDYIKYDRKLQKIEGISYSKSESPSNISDITDVEFNDDDVQNTQNTQNTKNYIYSEKENFQNSTSLSSMET